MNLDIVTILSQTPLIIALGILLYYFQKDQDRRETERSKQWQKFFHEQQKENNIAMKEMSEQVTKNTEQIARLTAAILLHDATVRGTNPDTMGTTEEIFKKVLEV